MSIETACVYVSEEEEEEREMKGRDEESVFQCLILSASLNLFVFCSPQRVILDSVCTSKFVLDCRLFC